MLKSLNGDKYDQELISSLIVALREKLPNGGMAREIGDFIAHPLLKNRGRVHANVKKVHEALLSAYNKSTNSLNGGTIQVENPFHINDALVEMEQTITTFSQSLALIRTDKRVAEIQACMLFLLQGARIKIEKLDGVESIELKIAVNTAGKLCLMAVLPTPVKVVTANNETMYPLGIKYEIITSDTKFISKNTDASGFGYFDGILNARRMENGNIMYSLIVPRIV